MRRKKAESNNELWLISYADLVTLLFGLFVLLFATQNDGLKQLTESVAKEFESKETKPSDKPVVAEKKQVSDELKKSKYPNECRLCFWYALHPPREIQDELGLPSEGEFVVHVDRGTSAEKSGLKDMDFITKINGQVVDPRHPEKLRLWELPVNSFVTMEVIRDHKTIQLQVQLDDIKDLNSFDSTEYPEEDILLGIRGHKISDQDRIHRAISNGLEGWIVDQVPPRYGVIKKNDLILHFEEIKSFGISQKKYFVKFGRQVSYKNDYDYNWTILRE